MLSSGGSHSNGSDRHGACHGQQEQIRVRHYDETTKPNRLLKQRESDAPSKSSSVSCKKYVLMMAYKLRDMSDVRKSTHVRKIFFLKIQPINKKEYVVSAQNFFQFFFNYFMKYYLKTQNSISAHRDLQNCVIS